MLELMEVYVSDGVWDIWFFGFFFFVLLFCFCFCVVFFFQAEDGIRDVAVTGVQTCALPIYLASKSAGKTASSNNFRLMR